MRVILPFVSIEDGVLEALGVTGYAVELRDVSGSDSDYWRLLTGLWREAADVCVVEQDIIVEPSTLQGFDDCPNLWCSAQYRYLGSENYTGLGCTRFRGELMRKHPEVMVKIGEMEDPNHAPRHWCVNDAHLQRELRATGERVCVHGHVVHVSDGVPEHRCCGVDV